VYGIIVDATGYPVKPGMFSAGYAVLFPGNRFIKQRVILCPVVILPPQVVLSPCTR
jgi:hypothetical protein